MDYKVTVNLTAALRLLRVVSYMVTRHRIWLTRGWYTLRNCAEDRLS